MISLVEAYNKIKTQMDEPIIYLAEDNTYYIGSNTFYVLVNKESGEITKLYDVVSFIIETDIDSLRHIYLEDVFNDFMDYYLKNKDEKHLASLYASVWKQVYYYSPEYYKSKRSYTNDEMNISNKWNEIEHILYKQIISIIEDEDIDYPPCVKKNFDDRFFRIKPFMLRYGYTDNGDREWVKEAARLTPLEAYNKFIKTHPEKTNVRTISDFGDFYLCSNSISRDYVDGAWKLNPFSGEAMRIDIAGLAEELRKHPEEDIIEYTLSDLMLDR